MCVIYFSLVDYYLPEQTKEHKARPRIDYFGQTPMKKLLFFPFHDTQNLPKNENVEKEETWNNSVQINVGKR